MIGTDSLSVVSWTINDFMAAGEVGEGQIFSCESRKIKMETVK